MASPLTSFSGRRVAVARWRLAVGPSRTRTAGDCSRACGTSSASVDCEEHCLLRILSNSAFGRQRRGSSQSPGMASTAAGEGDRDGGGKVRIRT